MFFTRRRRRSSFNLIGALLVGLGMYGSGAGGWLTARIAKLPNACFLSLGSESICGAVSTAAKATVSAANFSGKMLDGLLENTKKLGVSFDDAPQMRQAAQGLSGLDQKQANRLLQNIEPSPQETQAKIAAQIKAVEAARSSVKMP
jgi:hypothetical protein